MITFHYQDRQGSHSQTHTHTCRNSHRHHNFIDTLFLVHFPLLMMFVTQKNLCIVIVKIYIHYYFFVSLVVLLLALLSSFFLQYYCSVSVSVQASFLFPQFFCVFNDISVVFQRVRLIFVGIIVVLITGGDDMMVTCVIILYFVWCYH